jgi:5-methylcytosine-specific restriction protein A
LFRVGRTYLRSDIHTRYGGQEQGGISTPAEFPIVFLFTGAESGARYGYRDGWESDGTFRVTGEGQVGDMKFTPGNIAIRDHEKNGEDLHVFQYITKGKVRYVGQMLYVRYELAPNVVDRRRSRRTVIVFHLVPIQISGEARLGKPVDAAGRDVRRSWYWEAPLHEVRAAALDQPQREMTPQQALRNVYHRSEAVRIAVLRRANGLCEGCGQPAPFKARDGRPYLEPHHTHRLSDHGPDQPKWVIAVCPTCHRRAHYAEDAETYNEKLKLQATRLDEQLDKSS